MKFGLINFLYLWYIKIGKTEHIQLNLDVYEQFYSIYKIVTSKS